MHASSMAKHHHPLARTRERRGLTQKGLAELAGVAQSTVSRIESGECTPDVVIALRLAAALKTTVARLFSVPDAEPQPVAPTGEAA